MFDKKTQNFLSVGVLSIFLIGFGWYNYSVYHELRNLVYDKVDQRLLGAAKGTVLLLDEDFHERAKDPGSISALEDANNINKLSQFAKVSGVEYVYTMIRSGENIFFTSSSATQEELASGNLLTRYYD